MRRVPDVQVVRPEFTPTIEERRLAPSYLGGRPAPLNDGFVITDDAVAKGTVIAVDGQSRADYDRMVKGFKYNASNYQEAYKEAARTGKPIVAVFGGFENNNSRQLIQDSLPKANDGASKDAIYLYVDRAQCKNPELAKFADSQLSGGHNAAVSLVFSVKPGEDGRIQPEPANFRWQGADSSMISSFNKAVADAANKQESYKGKFAPEAIAEAAPSTNVNPDGTRALESNGTRETENNAAKIISDSKITNQTGAEKLSAACATITDQLSRARNSTNWHESETSYHAAIKAADQIPMESIRAEAIRISTALRTAPENSLLFQQLTTESKTLELVHSAKANIRAELGLACMNWANKKDDQVLKNKFQEIGAQWIDAAAGYNPDIYNSLVLNRQLRGTGIPESDLKSLLPKLGKHAPQDLYSFGGETQSLQKPTTVQSESDSVPPPPPPGVFSLESPIQNLSKEQRKEIEREDEEKAVKSEAEFSQQVAAAQKRGLPIIVKVGSESCGPCKNMAPLLKETEEKLKDQAAVIRVLAENTPELASSLGADEGIPITKVMTIEPQAQTAVANMEEVDSKRGFTLAGSSDFTKFLEDALKRHAERKRRELKR